MMLRKALLAAFALSIAGSAHGAVTYDFSFTNDYRGLTETGSFSATLPFFAIYTTDLAPYLNSCSVTRGGVDTGCQMQNLIPELLGLEGNGDVVFFADDAVNRGLFGGDVYSSYLRFAEGAFSSPGSYASLDVNHVGSLTVSGTPNIVQPPPVIPGPIAAAPEPASWALMILGFGSIGALARRRLQTNPGLCDR